MGDDLGHSGKTDLNADLPPGWPASVLPPWLRDIVMASVHRLTEHEQRKLAGFIDYLRDALPRITEHDLTLMLLYDGPYRQLPTDPQAAADGASAVEQIREALSLAEFNAIESMCDIIMQAGERTRLTSKNLKDTIGSSLNGLRSEVI